ncbi:MAG: hypothetical protein LC808_22345, partial [Actinobacteria bacterium]|nr:hypothetical protein [Actinomycetota bacterium]
MKVTDAERAFLAVLTGKSLNIFREFFERLSLLSDSQFEYGPRWPCCNVLTWHRSLPVPSHIAGTGDVIVADCILCGLKTRCSALTCVPRALHGYG